MFRFSFLLTLFREAFHEIAKSYQWLILFVFGGLIGLPLLLQQLLNSWSQAIFYSGVLYGCSLIVFLLLGFFILLSRARERISHLESQKYQDEQQSFGLSIYKQINVEHEVDYGKGSTIMSASRIEIEVETEGGVSIIPHYNRLPASSGTTFEEYHCEGKVEKIPDGYAWSFNYYLRGAPRPNAVDIVFSFTPPLPLGTCVEYVYEQLYTNVLPMTHGDILTAMKNRVAFKDEAKEVSGYKILCKTDRLCRKVRFPVGYELASVTPDVLYQGTRVDSEVARAKTKFKAEKKGQRWNVIWEVDHPKQDYIYYIKWAPAYSANPQ